VQRVKGEEAGESRLGTAVPCPYNGRTAFGVGADTITNAYDYWDGVVYPAGALGIKHGLRHVIRRNDHEFQAGGSYYWG
jgi:hypothetical protein